MNIGRPLAEGFFWAIHLTILWFQPSRASHRRAGRVLVGLGTTAAAVAYWVLTRDLAGALFGASLAISGTWAYATNESAAFELGRLEAERVDMARRLDLLTLGEERLRIARELHDGIGANLTAILWRAQRIQRGAPAAILHDLRKLSQRASFGLSELRTSVWALSSPSRSWLDLVEYVRQRAHEIQPEATVADGSPNLAEHVIGGELGLHVVRAADAIIRTTGHVAQIELRAESAELLTIFIELAHDASSETALHEALERARARVNPNAAALLLEIRPGGGRRQVRIAVA
jgi:hypothetical protein